MTFLSTEVVSGMKICSKLSVQYMTGCIIHMNTYEWVRRFNEGRNVHCSEHAV